MNFLRKAFPYYQNSSNLPESCQPFSFKAPVTCIIKHWPVFFVYRCVSSLLDHRLGQVRKQVCFIHHYSHPELAQHLPGTQQTMRNTESDLSVKKADLSYLLIMSSASTLLPENSTILGSNLRKCHPRKVPERVLGSKGFLMSSNTKIVPLRPRLWNSHFSSTSSLYIEFLTIHNDSLLLLLSLLLKYSSYTITKTLLKVTRWDWSPGKFWGLCYKGLHYLFGQVPTFSQVQIL